MTTVGVNQEDVLCAGSWDVIVRVTVPNYAPRRRCVAQMSDIGTETSPADRGPGHVRPSNSA